MTGNTDKNRAKALQWQISSWKNALIEPDEAAHLANDEISSSAALLYRDYDKTLRAYQASISTT
jgi:ATP-dependent DNA helicase Rep